MTAIKMPGPELNLLSVAEWSDYALLDSGSGQRLDRFGPYLFVRPEQQAIWRPGLPKSKWEAAHAVFTPTAGSEAGGRWQVRRDVPASWPMRYGREPQDGQLKFVAHFTSSRHLGVFPEQAAHWDWIMEKIAASCAVNPGVAAPRVLNLFGYTGLATLAACAAGAHVTHVDAAKKSVGWGRENQALSGLEQRPVRWLVDDALKYVEREGRRGARYDGLLMDPPKFGRGPQGEVWDALEMLPRLLAACRLILAERPLFVIITAYAIRASALSLHYALEEMMSGKEGVVTSGELALCEQSAGRLLPTSIYARWEAHKGGQA